MGVKEIPAWGWVALVLATGTAYLTWHRYANDDQDQDWTTPKETQPPTQLTELAAGTGPASGRAITCTQGFRGRRYPSSLTEDPESLVGGFRGY